MNIVFDVIEIVLLFALFGYSHTLLASRKLKKRLKKQLEDKIAFYRLFYNISSLLIFFAFWTIAPRPNIIIYDLHYPYDIVIFTLQFLSLLGFFWAGSAVDLNEFAGIAQIKRWMHGEYQIEDLDEKSTLYVKGAFKYMRHPIYFFSILFLGFRPTMNLFYFVTFLCITAYFIIGSYYEEKKLVEIFGDEYLNYQKHVPRIIPYKIFNKKEI